MPKWARLCRRERLDEDVQKSACTYLYLHSYNAPELSSKHRTDSDPGNDKSPPCRVNDFTEKD